MPNPKPSTRGRRDAFDRDVASHDQAPLFGDLSQHKQSLMTTDRAVSKAHANSIPSLKLQQPCLHCNVIDQAESIQARRLRLKAQTLVLDSLTIYCLYHETT